MKENAGKFSKGGSYAEYCVTNAYQCIPLDDHITWERGANCICNPLSAIGLLDRVQAHNAKAVI